MRTEENFLLPVISYHPEIEISSPIIPSQQQMLSQWRFDSEKWEIPRNQIRLGGLIGRGAFGKVVKATIECDLSNESFSNNPRYYSGKMEKVAAAKMLQGYLK